MNFEVVTYGLVLASALIFAAANNASRIAFRYSLWSITFLYVISIRLAEFDGDIVVYAREFLTKSNSLYYLKEAIYWFSTRWIFSVTGNQIITFIVVDMILVSMFFLALRMFKAPKYSYFLILIVFPSVFGFQNIYRQLIASSVLLLGLGLTYAGRRGWALSGLSAALVHNPSALLVPLFPKFARRSPWVGGFVGLILGAALTILSRFESSSSSGGNFSFILSSIVLAIVGVLTLRIASQQKPYLGFFLGLGAISALSPLFLASSTSERISFYIIMMLFPFLVVWVEHRVRPRIPTRAFLIFVLAAPTFLSSARGFILY